MIKNDFLELQKIANKFFNMFNCKQKYWRDTNMIEKVIDNKILHSIKEYIEKVSEYYKIETAILFGSYVKGTEN